MQYATDTSWANSKPDRVRPDGLDDGHPQHLSGPVASHPKLRQFQHQTGHRLGPHHKIVEITSPTMSATPESAPISEGCDDSILENREQGIPCHEATTQQSRHRERFHVCGLRRTAVHPPMKRDWRFRYQRLSETMIASGSPPQPPAREWDVVPEMDFEVEVPSVWAVGTTPTCGNTRQL